MYMYMYSLDILWSFGALVSTGSVIETKKQTRKKNGGAKEYGTHLTSISGTFDFVVFNAIRGSLPTPPPPLRVSK